MTLPKKSPRNTKQQKHVEVARPSKKQQKNAAADKSKKLLKPPKPQPQDVDDASKPIGPSAKKLALGPEQKQKQKQLKNVASDKSQKVQEPPKAKPQEDDTDASEPDLPTSGLVSKKTLIPQKKSISTENLLKPRKKEKPIFASDSYAVDLFGRTMDLSKMSESTPLYSMCRAWMSNQPRNTALSTCSTDGGNITVKREDNAEEVLAQLTSGELSTLSHIPRARSTNLKMVPPRMVYTDEEMKKDAEMRGAKGEVLLGLNVARWKSIRQHWLEHTRKYNQERYELIDQIVNLTMKDINK